LLKESENPPITWPSEKPICDFMGLWRVAHTKSRNEKALAQDLIHKQVSYFLPMTWKVQHKSGRKTRTLLPLFSSYLFFCGGENERLEVLRTNRVANIIEVTDQQKLLDELSKIEQALRKGACLESHPYVKTGQRCRVTAGPLMGMEGIVLKTRAAARLILQVDILGQAASIEIDLDTIEIID
jgi:transcription antitermination factor NusG